MSNPTCTFRDLWGMILVPRAVSHRRMVSDSAPTTPNTGGEHVHVLPVHPACVSPRCHVTGLCVCVCAEASPGAEVVEEDEGEDTDGGDGKSES